MTNGMDVLDARWNEVEKSFGKFLAGAREDEHMDPELMIARIEQWEDMLLPFIAKEVVEGWIFNGFSFQANKDAVSILPVNATMRFNHKSRGSLGETIEWGQSGFKDCRRWLQEQGFPVFEVDLTME